MVANNMTVIWRGAVVLFGQSKGHLTKCCHLKWNNLECSLKNIWIKRCHRSTFSLNFCIRYLTLSSPLLFHTVPGKDKHDPQSGSLAAITYLQYTRWCSYSSYRPLKSLHHLVQVCLKAKSNLLMLVCIFYYLHLSPCHHSQKDCKCFYKKMQQMWLNSVEEFLVRSWLCLLSRCFFFFTWSDFNYLFRIDWVKFVYDYKAKT